jgi:predicted DNA binding CopG/RHH family protein
MTMKKITEKLPRPADELAELATHYDTHDTAEEMDRGEWVDPRPMRTTSLRLPGEVVDALKELAQARGVRYTALVREMLEQALREAARPDGEELSEINARLARIEQAVADQERRQKRAMRSVASTRHTSRVHRRLTSKGARTRRESR